MSISNTSVKASYQGTGAQTAFAIPATLVVDDSAEVIVYLRDETDPLNPIVTLQVEGALNDYTLTGAPDADSFHVNVTFNTAPAAVDVVTIIRQLPLTQPLDLNPTGAVPLASMELAYDRLLAMIQQLQERISRAPVFNITEQRTDTEYEIPEPVTSYILTWNDTDDGWEWLSPTDVALAGASINGAADIAYDNAVSGLVAVDVQAAIDELAEGANYGYTGYSARFSESVVLANLQATLDYIMDITYTAPSISLSPSGNGTIREKGTAVLSSTLSATVTKRSDPIAAVRFYKSAVLVNTVASPNPAGGVETYAWSGSFSDNTTFQAEVDDNGATGGPTTVSTSASFTFVYPYYYGAGAVGLSAANVRATLTQSNIASTASKNVSITATAGQVFFFAYPASYGALTSILDVNLFETFSDWTLRTENITGLDTTAVSYRIYEFNNPVAAATYEYTFVR